MTGLITSKTQRYGAGGSLTLHDYFVVETDSPERHLQRMEIPVSDFPFEARQIGDRVQLDYISVGNGCRWMPVRLLVRSEARRI